MKKQPLLQSLFYQPLHQQPLFKFNKKILNYFGVIFKSILSVSKQKQFPFVLQT